MVEWRKILEFPNYSVSDIGHVLNDETDKEMVLHRNQRGIVNVSLSRGCKQYKRSVTVLVAKAFVKTARSLTFDTPINLDGDRSNNRAENLVWRPRWHAVEYYRQFEQPTKMSIRHWVEEVKTGEVYESSWDAAIRNGLLDKDVVEAIAKRTYVRPTFQVFRIRR